MSQLHLNSNVANRNKIVVSNSPILPDRTFSDEFNSPLHSVRAVRAQKYTPSHPSEAVNTVYNWASGQPSKVFVSTPLVTKEQSKAPVYLDAENVDQEWGVPRETQTESLNASHRQVERGQKIQQFQKTVRDRVNDQAQIKKMQQEAKNQYFEEKSRKVIQQALALHTAAGGSGGDLAQMAANTCEEAISQAKSVRLGLLSHSNQTAGEMDGSESASNAISSVQSHFEEVTLTKADAQRLFAAHRKVEMQLERQRVRSKEEAARNLTRATKLKRQALRSEQLKHEREVAAAEKARQIEERKQREETERREALLAAPRIEAARQMARAAENERYLAAMRQKLLSRVQGADIQVPPICPCSDEPLMHDPQECAPNCPVKLVPGAYVKLLASLINEYSL